MSAPSVSAPQPRNLTNELLQTYAGQSRTAGPYFNLESYFQPRYGQVQLGNLQQQLFGYNVPPGSTVPTGAGAPIPGGSPILNARGVPSRAGGTIPGGIVDPYSGNVTPSQTPGFHPGEVQLGAAANTFGRTADINDVAQLGPAATAAFLNSNPFLASGLTNLLGRTQNTPLLNTLNQNAQTALNLQGQLSPQEQRAADQQSRDALAARGLLTSSPAAVSEVLNRDALVRQRQAAAQQFAENVQGLDTNQADLVGRATQIFGTQLSDPFQAILGRSSRYGGTSGMPQQIGTGARLFDPTNPYASDLYNTNYNAAAAANIANANAQAGQQSGLLGLGGSVVGAALPFILDAFSDKRVKKNIRKTGEKTAAGVPIKTFQYKFDPTGRKYHGVLAQDVEKVEPRAVRTEPLSGLKAVRYGGPFDFVTGTLRKEA